MSGPSLYARWHPRERWNISALSPPKDTRHAPRIDRRGRSERLLRGRQPRGGGWCRCRRRHHRSHR
ncbi:protein of unknown function [Streptomyces sp. KY70]|nr:protein of unknown function [Streptomyces sp. KY70]